MTDVDGLVDTLVIEGYQLYPYTPEATKNATPTPFGIVYPPNYAAQRRDHDHDADGVPAEGEQVSGELRCLAAEARGSSCRAGRGGVRPRRRGGPRALRAGGGRLALEVRQRDRRPDGLARAAALRTACSPRT